MHIPSSFIWLTLLFYNSMLLIFTERYLHPKWIERGMTLFSSPNDKKQTDDSQAHSTLSLSWLGSNKLAYTMRYAFIPLMALPAWYFFAFQGTRGIWLSTLAVSTVCFYSYFIGLSDLLYTKLPSGASWMSLGLSSLFILFYAVYYHSAGVLWELIVSAMIFFLIGTTTWIVSKNNGFGGGDVRFMIALSALAPWFGWSVLLTGLLAGLILQFFLFLFRPILRKMDRYTGKGLPFIPSLIIGTLVAIILFHTSGQSCKDLTGFVSSC